MKKLIFISLLAVTTQFYGMYAGRSVTIKLITVHYTQNMETFFNCFDIKQDRYRTVVDAMRQNVETFTQKFNENLALSMDNVLEITGYTVKGNDPIAIQFRVTIPMGLTEKEVLSEELQKEKMNQCLPNFLFSANHQECFKKALDEALKSI